MKHVNKGLSPTGFEDWKAGGNEDWQPSYANLQNPEKRDLHLALLAEQGWVCCYCGRSVEQADSHVEHFRPQESRDDIALSYDNLFASCIRETKPGLPLHCGHAKGGNFDEARHVSPLDPQCEARFVHTQLGDIIANDERASYMVELLKLNVEFLRNRRKEVLWSVFDSEFLATVTPDELRTLRAAFRSRDASHRLPDFGHVVARFAEQRLDEMA